MSSDDHHHHHHHHHHHKTHKVLEKISSKISAIKEDIVVTVKDRNHSDHQNPMSSDHSLSNVDHANLTLHNDFSSASIETKSTFPVNGM
jgi:hypothetical protein